MISKSLKIKKKILTALIEGKSLTYAQLEKKVKTNWKSIRAHCQELQIFECVKIQEKQHHKINNRSYTQITITKKGQEVIQRI